MRAVQIDEFGGPEVLTLVEVPDPTPAPGESVIEVSRAGINYADTHQVENSYLAPTRLPHVPGVEVAGRTAQGERVVALLSHGGYATRAAAPDALTYPIPESVTDEQALALVVQGVTAWHLLRTCTHLEKGETVVIHAAAGGVGSLAVQLAKRWGAGRVIATASTSQKRELALSLGADAAVDPAAEDMRAALRQANDGRPVDVVLEMTGGSVFDASLAALSRFGRLAVYGMASRSQPRPVDPASLMVGSKTLTGFWLIDYLHRPELIGQALDELFAMVDDQTLAPVIGGTYPMADVAAAHRALRERRTTGKLVLDVTR